jgi:hypothetical protein
MISFSWIQQNFPIMIADAFLAVNLLKNQGRSPPSLDGAYPTFRYKRLFNLSLEAIWLIKIGLRIDKFG